MQHRINWIFFIVIFILTFGAFGTAGELRAQTLKNIYLSDGKPHTDHIAERGAAQELDLIVEIDFDEPNNALNVSLLSYRQLFVFRDPVIYRSAIKWQKLLPERLPYVIEGEPKTKYKVKKELRKIIKPEDKKRRKYKFSEWASSESLSAKTTDYKMVNDYIDQAFDITSKDDYIELKLNDIIMMRPKEKQSHRVTKYELFYMRNLDRRYAIKLMRNPCLGREKEIEDTTTQLTALQGNLAKLDSLHGAKGISSSRDSVTLFNQIKSTVQSQSTPMQLDSINGCPDLEKIKREYNDSLDKIKQMECYYVAPYGTAQQADANHILSESCRIDELVSTWQTTSDLAEKGDAYVECQKLISSMDSYLKNRDTNTTAARNAVVLYKRARAMFYRICK